MKCQIQWLHPVTHEATPDDNEAVAYVRQKDHVFTWPSGRKEAIRYSDKRGIPCCAEHLKRTPSLCWEILPLDTQGEAL